VSKQLAEDGLQHGETLSEESVKAAVGLLLGAALNDHLHDLNLVAFLDAALHELVGTFLKVEGAHNREVNRALEVRHVHLRLILKHKEVMVRGRSRTYRRVKYIDEQFLSTRAETFAGRSTLALALLRSRR